MESTTLPKPKYMLVSRRHKHRFKETNMDPSDDEMTLVYLACEACELEITYEYVDQPLYQIPERR